ncbi:MAG: DNA mismatch repair protein MutS, partial [Candidatus Thorarchaeota archaeon]
MKKPTPMQRQYLALKKQHPDSILLFRLGDFYEMFNEDAKVASEALNIVLTSRGEGVNKWPLCGVPHHSVEGYIAKLLNAGFTVALADQVEDASEAKGLVRREVVRLITPGTVLESNLLDDTSNNFLVALVEHDNQVGIAAVDVSTGEFVTTEFSAKLTDEKTLSEVSRLGPAELLLPESISKDQKNKDMLESVCSRITYRSDLDFTARSAEDRIKEQFKVTTLEGYGLGNKHVALGASGAIFAYLAEVYKTNAITITGLRTYSVEEHMIVDGTTQRNLELVKNARDGTIRGTLLEVLSKTVTPMGKRKLKQWILQPLYNKDEINKRLDAVDELARTAMSRKSVSDSQRNIGDLERVTSRIVFGTGGARDLVALRNALEKLPNIKKSIDACKSEMLKIAAQSIDPMMTVAQTLKDALLDEPPVSTREGK